MPVSLSMPDDVLVLHRCLSDTRAVAELDVNNCGTAMRFLTAYFAQKEGYERVLTGCERMQQRPIAQLVDALRSLGAEIRYVGREGYPPLRIVGRRLSGKEVSMEQPLSTQFVSALLLAGLSVRTDIASPYIEMTRAICQQLPEMIERDWSSAAFWYAYTALHHTELSFPGLSQHSMQGDRVVADIFVALGVRTVYRTDGVSISYDATLLSDGQLPSVLSVDFRSCPDLYPAIAIVCRRLGVRLIADGTDSLCYKESNRLLSVEQLTAAHDHRMAMALLVAGYACDDTACIRKSYPQFLEQLCSLQS